jgi:uncharacterized membrane protein (UPF0127 family)
MIALPACDGADETPPPAESPTPPPEAPELTAVSFDTATLTFITATDSIAMRVEIAERADQRAYGLMDRDELAPDAGMIFLHQQMQHQDSGFWMYRTRFPLDIAYFDGAGRIQAIRQMMPCTSTDAAQCVGYAAGVPFYGAVEANRGYFVRNGIGVGDRIVLPGRIGD